MTTAEIDLFIKVDSVPWVYSSLLDNSKEAYVITRKALAQSNKALETLIKARFGKASAVAYDESLRVYYIFVRKRDDTASS